MAVQTRPSNAWRWTKCSAAPLFAHMAGPRPSSDAADEGTCAAWLADEMVKNGLVRAMDMVGEKCPDNGWEVDLEMAGHIQRYVDMIWAEGGQASSERHVVLSPLVQGTLDNCATYIDGMIRVRDLKYGFRLVEADAEQLVIYAGGLAAELLDQGHPIREIVTEIYQPRGFHADGIHRRQSWTPAQIFERCRWIAQRAEECHKPNPVATAGPWCLECDGAAGCITLHNTAYNLVTHHADTKHREMDGHALGSALGKIREIKAIVEAATKALETEALARHTRGDRIHGWGRKERFGHRKLTKSRAAVKALTGVDPVVEKEMTPAQLEGSGVSSRKVDMVSHKPSIGFKLEKLNPRDLAKEFPQSTQGN